MQFYGRFPAAGMAPTWRHLTRAWARLKVALVRTFPRRVNRNIFSNSVRTMSKMPERRLLEPMTRVGVSCPQRLVSHSSLQFIPARVDIGTMLLILPILTGNRQYL